VIRHFRVFRSFLGAELQNELAYRLNFVLGIFEMLLVIGTSLGAVLVLFSHAPNLNGWTLPQMISLTGVYYVVQGGVNVIFSPSFEKLMEHVRQGTLDFTLLKPANTQFLVSTRHVRLVRLADMALGFGVIAAGLVMLGNAVTPWSIVTFVVTLACGIACVYALLLTLVTLAFWFVRVDNILAIFWAFTDAGRFPIDLYPGWLRPQSCRSASPSPCRPRRSPAACRSRRSPRCSRGRCSRSASRHGSGGAAFGRTPARAPK
jgi:ABC-2 type transport system permease protein